MAYGFDGVQVDGNNAIDVLTATRAALAKARGGAGPTLIECVTYRLADHTTADDASRYRSPDEVALWQHRDPLEKMRQYLAAEGLWNDQYRSAIETAAAQVVEKAVERYEHVQPPDPNDMLMYVVADLPWNLKEQAEQLRRDQ